MLMYIHTTYNILAIMTCYFGVRKKIKRVSLGVNDLCNRTHFSDLLITDYRSLHSYRGVREDVNLERYCHSRLYGCIVLTAHM